MAEKKLTFEQSMERLEAIVSRMESGETPLEESLKLFEEGTRLVRQCSALLDKAEQKVTKLTESEMGELTEVSFDGEA